MPGLCLAEAWMGGWQVAPSHGIPSKPSSRRLHAPMVVNRDGATAHNQCSAWAWAKTARSVSQTGSLCLGRRIVAKAVDGGPTGGPGWWTGGS